MLQAVETTSTSTEHPDAELIAACEAFLDLERYRRIQIASANTLEAEKSVEPTLDRIYGLQTALAKRMAQMRAVTLDGNAARARSLFAWDPAVIEEPDVGVEGLLVHSILRDLLAGCAAA